MASHQSHAHLCCVFCKRPKDQQLHVHTSGRAGLNLYNRKNLWPHWTFCSGLFFFLPSCFSATSYSLYILVLTSSSELFSELSSEAAAGGVSPTRCGRQQWVYGDFKSFHVKILRGGRAFFLFRCGFCFFLFVCGSLILLFGLVLVLLPLAGFGWNLSARHSGLISFSPDTRHSRKFRSPPLPDYWWPRLSPRGRKKTSHWVARVNGEGTISISTSDCGPACQTYNKGPKKLHEIWNWWFKACEGIDLDSFCLIQTLPCIVRLSAKTTM